MFFFDTVQTFATTGKSEKGKALQEMAKRFELVLVQGDTAPVEVVVAMRDRAQELDNKFRRGSATFVNLSIDSSGSGGQIEGLPVTEAAFERQPYFRIYFHKVVRTATIAEAIALTKGGAL